SRYGRRGTRDAIWNLPINFPERPCHGGSIMRLTTTTIRALTLPQGKKDHIVWDDLVPGFGVRLREGGSAGFVFQYAIGRKQRRMSLGAGEGVANRHPRKKTRRALSARERGARSR